MVGVGWPATAEDVTVRIVDAETAVDLGEDKVGEIWLDSPSKAQGYWSLDAAANAQVFGATLSASSAAGDERDGKAEEEKSEEEQTEEEPQGFLRTGDLGFIHRDARSGALELFVCGRLKDLIIVRGRNHYPQDLERTAERVAPAQLRPGCSACFSLPLSLSHGRSAVEAEADSGTHSAEFGSASEAEVLVLLAEVRNGAIEEAEATALIEALKRVLTEEHGALVLCASRLLRACVCPHASALILCARGLFSVSTHACACAHRSALTPRARRTPPAPRPTYAPSQESRRRASSCCDLVRSRRRAVERSLAHGARKRFFASAARRTCCTSGTRATRATSLPPRARAQRRLWRRSEVPRS